MHYVCVSECVSIAIRKKKENEGAEVEGGEKRREEKKESKKGNNRCCFVSLSYYFPIFIFFCSATVRMHTLNWKSLRLHCKTVRGVWQ